MQAKTNIAARAARWSATHRRTAIFGWLAFVVVSLVIGGAVGQRQLTDAETTSGEAGRAEVALERSGADPEQRGRAHSEPGSHRRRTGIRGGDRRHDPQPRPRPLGARAELARRSGAARSRPTSHSALVEFEIPGDESAAEARVDAILAPSPRFRSATRHARRAVRRRERQQGAGKGVQRRPREGRDDVSAGHAGPPRPRLRRPGRGPRAAAARLLGGAGDDRAAGDSQPDRADGPQRLLGRGPGRAGGRRRLLALLPAP